MYRRRQPRYLNNTTFVRDRPYAWKVIYIPDWTSSMASRKNLLLAPMAHGAVLGWQPLREFHGTNMPPWRNHRWGRMPSYRLTPWPTCKWIFQSNLVKTKRSSIYAHINPKDWNKLFIFSWKLAIKFLTSIVRRLYWNFTRRSIIMRRFLEYLLTLKNE